jgi:predicted DNA-binding transcriptional regulator YafY
MRADRLLVVLSLLQSNGRLTSRELASRLEVSERTVHRDMEALAIAGIPVYAERGSTGGWLLAEGYRNQLTGLTTEEIRSLLLLHSSSVVNDLGLQGQSRDAFRKLLSALPLAVRRDAEYVQERIHVDGAGWHTNAGAVSVADNTSKLRKVQQAVWTQCRLKIVYRSYESDNETSRIVNPLGLVAKRSVWYMVAQAEEEIRTFRISRLKNAELTEQAFLRPESFDLAAYWSVSTEQFKSSLPRFLARVRVASARWERFCQERYVKILSADEQQEGVHSFIEADVAFDTLESACQILLGYGRHAEALMPQPLCLAVQEEIHAMLRLYGHDHD